MTRIRRTQAERREATVSKLVDAMIATIAELGYARASVGEVCSRAGVSQGGLFRHFDSRLDLVVAAAEEVARRQLTAFIAAIASVRVGDDLLISLLSLVRERCRAPINSVWHELMLAARTDAELRAKLQPALDRYGREIKAVASSVPGLTGIEDARLAALVFTILHVFDGEAFAHFVRPTPELEDARLELLADMVRAAFGVRAN